jgi:hypothetical protein
MRSSEHLHTLLESIEFFDFGAKRALRSTIEAISDPKHIPCGSDLTKYLTTAKAGDRTLQQLLVEALVELCKVKPVGHDCVQWLGRYLLEHNPNKPRVEDPDIA